ncbi:MAG: branched-chain amino acid ABC transporter permease [Chloroflexi bacterium]|nr:branched-chain amino acid ABC transporter permease [Chloroflexota bacterium]
MLTELPQHIVNGLIIGGIYALMGVGLTLIFGIMNVVNFAHGELYMLGAYAIFLFNIMSGINFFLALPLAILALMILGAVSERLVLRPLRAQVIFIPMLATIGLSVFFQNLALLIWGGTPKPIPDPFSPSPIVLGPIYVTPIRLFIMVVTFALILGVHLFLQKTRMGKAMRATFQDRETAALLGVNIDVIYGLTFAIGAGLAAAAGALLGPLFLVFPTMGELAAMKAFAVVIMAGLGNFPGAIAAGLILGVAESLGAGYISSGYKDAIGFIAIILVLTFRPAGLFGRVSRVG